MSYARKHTLCLRQSPVFEKMLAEPGIVMFKFGLEVGRAMQLKQFHERRHNPLKIWKLSPIDYVAMEKWDANTVARDEMFAATHNDVVPCTIATANKMRHARLNIIRIRDVLGSIEYADEIAEVSHLPDPRIPGFDHNLAHGD